MKFITETVIENFALDLLQSLGWQYAHGKTIAPGAQNSERDGFAQVVLARRLQSAIKRINPDLPADLCAHAARQVERIASLDLLASNEIFQKMLTEGVPLSRQISGEERGETAWLVDWERPDNNEFLAVNQFTVIENGQNKRPDVLLFVNGLPLVVIELKNAADEKATVRSAFDQIKNYQSLIPSLFVFNAFNVASDGLEARAGSLSASLSRYAAWKTVDGEREASRFMPQLEVLIRGMLVPARLLDLVRNFIVFEKSKKEDPVSGQIRVETVKKLAAYHQYFAVNKAVVRAHEAAKTGGDRKGGVVWHTQGSGKSLSMVFFAGKLVQSLGNPTLVVLTDRNDLDDQLFDTFAAAAGLLRQTPVQAESREHLKKLLRVASGGIVFTTIQKFLPDTGATDFEKLSDRQNIVVIADEAHRTQYGFEAKMVDVRDPETREIIGKRIAYGFAKYMRDALPNATYIGFTGTPVESKDVNTPAVFGDYVDIYDISQAVADGATVRIYYESRLAKVNLDEEGRRLLEDFDREMEENADATEQQKAKARWAKLEAIVGHPKRLDNLAADIVSHFEARQTVFQGKGMVVAMSRRIAAELYQKIIALRPGWHDSDLRKGKIKIVMTTSSSDKLDFDPEDPDGLVIPDFMRTTKADRKTLADRMRDENDPLELVIVRDMWLTGFDAPSLHTLYVDKPMRGHNLMQAIARVNRVFKDKPGGLVVDYLGIGTDLKKALSFYSEAGGKGDPTEMQAQAVEAMLEKLDVARAMFLEKSENRESILAEAPAAYGKQGFNLERFHRASPQGKMAILLQSEEHILGLKDGKSRFVREVAALGQAHALAVPNEEAMSVIDEIAIFQAIKSRLQKFDADGGSGGGQNMESAIKQLVDEALSAEGVVDIFDAAGIQKPEISILDEGFLLEIQGMSHQNLALELLKKILNDEIKTRSRVNVVKSQALLLMLENAIKRYQNNLLTTSEIITELINIARNVRESDQRGEQLNLTEDEIAFYDALEVNDSAVQDLGDEKLRDIARDIAEKVKKNATIDWTMRDSARAALMVIVRRTLKKHGYPPDKQEKAAQLVLRQAEVLADFWTGSPFTS